MLSILFPAVCFGCNAHLSDGERYLCTACRTDLPLTEYNYVKENPIDRIFYGRIPIVKSSAYLFFSEKGIVKNLMHNLKYKGHEEIGKFLGELYGHNLAKSKSLPKIDYVVPVPLHPRKKRKRGYNQVRLFSKCIAHHLHSSMREDILYKTANTKTLTKKGRIARWAGSQDLYQVYKNQDLTGKSILLADDIITTGSTMEACAKALKNAGDPKIFLTAMAVTPLEL